MGYRINQEKEDALFSWAIHAANQVSIGIANENIASLKGSEFIQVIWDKPKNNDDHTAKRPAFPYCSLKISSIEEIGKPAIEYYSLDTWAYYIRKKIILSINVYGYEYSFKTMNYLINSIHLYSYQQIFQAEKIACWGAGAPLDLSELEENVFNHRVQADFIFSFPDPVLDVPMEIHKVTVNGIINDSLNVSQDIEIS